jgi:dihydrofolate reductase
MILAARGGHRTMSHVTCQISVSLDGFVAGPNQSLENPLGEGGDRLHEWAFATASWREQHGKGGGEHTADADVADAMMRGVGAFVMGRKMFGGGDGPWDEDWRGWWGEDPPFHAPVFVLTHHPREPLEMQGGTTGRAVGAARRASRLRSALAEPVRRLRVRSLGEGQHLGRLDAEHRGRVLALALAEDAVADLEVPDTAVLRLVGVGESLQAFLLGHADRSSLDDDVETLGPGVGARGQRHLRTLLEVAGLLLAQAGAEVHHLVLRHADQRGHVRSAVGSHRREPVQLGMFEHVRCV